MIAHPRDLAPVPHNRVADTVFVGQAPGSSSDPLQPLLGRSGARLATLLDMTMPQFALFRRVNLNQFYSGRSDSPKGDRFDDKEGKVTAAVLLLTPALTHYVLLGEQVAACFGFRYEPLKVHNRLPPEPKHPRGRRKYLILPHPSGVALFWNEPFNVYRARRALRDFLAEDQPTNQ